MTNVRLTNVHVAAAPRQITMPSPSERIKLIALLDAWVAAVGSRKMLGGSEPNMADLAVYGALNSIEGVDTFKEVLEQVWQACWVSSRALGLLCLRVRWGCCWCVCAPRVCPPTRASPSPPLCLCLCPRLPCPPPTLR